MVNGKFDVKWDDDILICSNYSVTPNAADALGIPSGCVSSESSRNFVLARLATKHPDGGQVFFPPPGCGPFVMLLAPAAVGDDVRPEHFTAFYFDGLSGFQIAPGTWHNPPYFKPPSPGSVGSDKGRLTFRNKQSSVFACVWVDTIKEFGVILKFPLSLDA